MIYSLHVGDCREVMAGMAFPGAMWYNIDSS